MKNSKVLTIVVLALALMVCLTGAAGAEPMGTAFTYQGRLMDANKPADGLYDIEFKLFDDPCTGTQQGSTINFNDLDVIDGHFTVELDFGSDVFNGDARWLETTVAQINGSDPCTLRPRIEVTPIPYALQTRGMFVDNTGNVGIGTSSPSQKLDVSGNINYSGELTKLDVADNFIATVRAADFMLGHSSRRGSPGRAIVDGNDNLILNFDGDWDRTIIYGATTYIDGNVGIGTLTPEEKLTVVDGTIKCTKNGSGGWAIHGEASGWYGQGVYGYGTSFGGRGVYGKAGEDLGIGVYGKAVAEGQVTNYGGYFSAAGDWGLGIYGMATATGSVANCGGSFSAAGDSGEAVHGKATATGEVTNFGGYFEAAGGSGRGIYGEATNTSDIANYGGYFVSKGGRGKGVYGEASNTGNFQNEGGRFAAQGRYGRGVYGNATGEEGRGVYGLASSSSGTNYGVYGQTYSDDGYAGYFSGNVYVTNNVSALSFTDRTPYPKDLTTAYQAVMSMERLPDGQYDENNKQEQLDHSMLSDFIRSDDGNRDLSATVSCLNEVVKDLVCKQQELNQAKIRIDKLNKQNRLLEARLVKLEAIVAQLNVSQEETIK